MVVNQLVVNQLVTDQLVVNQCQRVLVLRVEKTTTTARQENEDGAWGDEGSDGEGQPDDMPDTGSRAAKHVRQCERRKMFRAEAREKV